MDTETSIYGVYWRERFKQIELVLRRILTDPEASILDSDRDDAWAAIAGTKKEPSRVGGLSSDTC